jgi:hypothetical protein
MEFDTESQNKNSSTLSQATTSNHANVFTFTIIVTEGRANEDWETSNKGCSFSSHNKMSLTSEFHLIFYHFLTSFRPPYLSPSGLGQSTTVAVQAFNYIK